MKPTKWEQSLSKSQVDLICTSQALTPFTVFAFCAARQMLLYTTTNREDLLCVTSSRQLSASLHL